MESISLGLSILCSVGVAVSLGLAIYYFIRNRLRQGYAFCLLMFLCVVLAYVPQLDSIKGGFLDAKFNRTLNQANDIIARLSKLAVTNARVSYSSLAWGNRWTTPYARDKQAILDEVDQQLVDLNVSASERRTLSRTFVNLVGVDLSVVYAETMQQVVQEKIREAGERTTKQPVPEGAQAEYQKVIAASAAWNKELGKNYLVENFDMSDHLLIPAELLDEREQTITKKFAEEIMAAFVESDRKGGYSANAAALVDEYNANPQIVAAQRARQIFGPTFPPDK
jgi:hypothetical protein